MKERNVTLDRKTVGGQHKREQGWNIFVHSIAKPDRLPTYLKQTSKRFFHVGFVCIVEHIVMLL